MEPKEVKEKRMEDYMLVVLESVLMKGALGIGLIAGGIYGCVMTVIDDNKPAGVIRDIDGDGVEDIVLRNGKELIRRGDIYFTPEDLKEGETMRINKKYQTELAQLNRFGNPIKLERSTKKPIQWVRNPWDNIDYKVRKDQIRHVRYTPRRTQVR